MIVETKKLNCLNLFVIGTLFIALGIFVLNTETLILSAIIYVFGFAFSIV